MFRKATLIILAAVTSLVCVSPCLAQATGKETVQELVTLFSAWSDKGGRQGIYEAAARRIDFPTMSEMAFTPAQWDRFTPPEKRDLTHAFRALVERRYYSRWHKLFLRSRLTVANEAKAGGDLYVKTFVTEKKDEDTVVWRLRVRNGEPLVIGMNVNGKDLVTRLAARFQKQLKKRGTQGLIAWLKNRADEDEELSDDSSANLRDAASK